jgi:hypothetical protein
MLRAIRLACATRVVCILTLFAVAAGSTSMHRAPVVAGARQPSPSSLHPGDDVRVTMRDGTTARFHVEKVEPAAIVATDGARYEVADIVTLERRQFSGRRTALLLLGIPVGAFLLGMVAFTVEGK